MKNGYAFLFFLLSNTMCIAQTTGSLHGKLADSTSKQLLKDASVSLLNPQDSTLEMVTLSKTDGSFEMKQVAFGTYLLQISYQGYTSIYRKIAFSKATHLY
jgi:hypothetical protein